MYAPLFIKLHTIIIALEMDLPMKKKLLQSLIGASALALSLGVAASEPTTYGPSDPCNPDCTRGPNPTVSMLEADRGPYSVRTINVSGFQASGFGDGTIHYPTNAGGGKMGAIAVIPGFVSYENSIEWWGPRLASHGFVVITTNTNTIYDQPDSRADQLSAALDHLIDESNDSSSPIHDMIDENRLGAIGWSMGGGGSLKLATQRNINAIIPQAPYYAGSNDFDEIQTPALILACESDAVAPVGIHASPFYYDIPSSTPKAFLEINGGSHFCANSGYSDEDILGKYGVAWMKRFIDFDTRYSQFLCGPNHEGDYDISEYRENCPY
jgi:triacylglycerol lipase